MRNKDRKDSDGSDIRSAATRIGAQAVALVGLLRAWEKTTSNETHIRSVTIYPPSRSRNGQWLVIGKSWHGGYKLVAFHRGTDALTALLGFFQRASEEKLIWKEDSYADR